MSNRVGKNLFHSKLNKELVRMLVDEGVNFVVVGGLAVAWHCSQRQADDMDLLVEPTPENSERIARSLARLGFAGFSNESFARMNQQIPLKSNFYAELLTPRTDSLSFTEVEADAVNANLFGIPVLLASASTLIEMKKCTVRSSVEQQEKHLFDIALLERAILQDEH